MRNLILFIAASLLSASAWATEAEVDLSPPPGHRYLVTTTHTADQCLSVLDDMAARKKRTLSKMQWGCGAGDHTGYMFVEATDRDAALQMLPESSRGTARVVEVTKFSPKQLKALHAKTDKPAAPRPAAK